MIRICPERDAQCPNGMDCPKSCGSPHTLAPREKVAEIVRDGMNRLAASQAGARPVVSASKEADRVTDAILTALASGSGDHAPVAWRVKDFADGWIVCGAEQTAIGLSAAMSGATVHPLYGPALVTENAALRVLADDAAKHSMRQTDKLLAEHDRATEAERKLAEADRGAEFIARLLPSAAGLETAPDNKVVAVYINMRELRQARTFLSKEAERG